MASPDLHPQPPSGQVLLLIVTPEGLAYQGLARLVELPTPDGELGIFPGHVPLFVELGTGEIRAYGAGEIERFVVSGGYVQVGPDSIRVLAHFALPGEAEAKIDEACRRAEEALEMAADLPPEQIQEDLTALRAEMLRMKMGGKR